MSKDWNKVKSLSASEYQPPKLTSGLDYLSPLKSSSSLIYDYKKINILKKGYFHLATDYVQVNLMPGAALSYH